MKMHRILPLAAAVLLAAGCSAATPTAPAADAADQKGIIMGGSGGYTGSGPRMDGVNMGGSGGFTGGTEGTATTSSNGGTLPGDSTSITGRGVQMGGSGG